MALYKNEWENGKYSSTDTVLSFWRTLLLVYATSVVIAIITRLCCIGSKRLPSGKNRRSGWNRFLLLLLHIEREKLTDRGVERLTTAQALGQEAC